MMIECNPSGKPGLAILWLAFFIVATIIASLLAKYLMIMGAYLSGMGMPLSRIYPTMAAGAICTGLMLAAPLWSAMFFALTPFSRRVRLAVALVWFTVAGMAQFAGGKALPDFDSPALFRPGTLALLPIVTLGWCLPFVLMRVFRGWQIQFPGSKSSAAPTNISITSLLTATFVAGICLAALRLGSSSIQFAGLIGMLVAVGLGFVAVPVAWCVMRTKHYFLFSIGLVAGVFAVSYLIPYLIYGPTRFAYLLPLLWVAFAQGIVSVLVAARLYGATLTTLRGKPPTLVPAMGDT